MGEGEEKEENPPSDIRIIFVYQRHRNNREGPVEIITVPGRRVYTPGCSRARGRPIPARGRIEKLNCAMNSELASSNLLAAIIWRARNSISRLHRRRGKLHSAPK